MKQLNLFYENVRYQGRTLSFYYQYIWPGFKDITKDFVLYNSDTFIDKQGMKSQHTISSDTIDTLIRKHTK